MCRKIDIASAVVETDRDPTFQVGAEFILFHALNATLPTSFMIKSIIQFFVVASDEEENHALNSNLQHSER